MRERIERYIGNGLLAFLATLVVHGIYTRGRPIFGTDTQLYVSLADDLLHGRLSNVFTPDAVRWSKLIYIVVLATARRFAPVNWPSIMMAFNLFCSATAAAILTRFIFRVTRSTAATLAALIYYLAIIDIAYWVPFVLTDIPYLLVALLPYVVVGRAVAGQPMKRHRLMLALACIASAISRPPGIIVAATAIFADIVFVPRSERYPRLCKAMFATLFAGIVIAFCARTYIVQHPERWPFRWIRNRIDFIAGIEREGQVMFLRREFDAPPPRTFGDYANLELERFARVFQFTAANYSNRHNAINVIVFGSLYLLGAYAVLDAMRRRDTRWRGLVFATLLWICISALFLTLTMLDGEWRFRVPMLQTFIALGVFGIAAITRRDVEAPLA